MADAFSLDADDFVASSFAALDELSTAMGESVLRQAAVAGARVFRDEAKILAPEKSGVLKRNIIVKHIDERSEGNTMQVYFVTVRHGKYGADGDAFYWRWVEEGHKKSKPKAKEASITLHRKAMDLEFGTARVAAKPYMRPAYEHRRLDAITAMRSRLAEAVTEAIRKFNK